MSSASTTESRRAEIVAAIEQVLADVRVAVHGLARDDARVVAEVIAGLRANPPPLPVGEIAEAIQFLEWLIADNFTFLGVRDYQLTPGMPCSIRSSRPGWGCCARARCEVLRGGDGPLELTPEIWRSCNEPRLLIVTKSAVRSRVHRRVHMDYVGIKRFDRGRQAHRRVPHRRPVHLDRLYALDAVASPICGARSTPS